MNHCQVTVISFLRKRELEQAAAPKVFKGWVSGRSYHGVLRDPGNVFAAPHLKWLRKCRVVEVKRIKLGVKQLSYPKHDFSPRGA